ncbi:MAG: methyltransferase [Polyangiaceae bacterium]|jgi:SAM-dependent methyltransferase
MLPFVELPDTGRLLSMGPAAMRALGERLGAVGLGAPFASRLVRVGERLDDALRAPMRTWHARRMPEPAAIAARVFLLHDPVEASQALAALGDLAPLLEAGFVEERDGGIVARVHLALAGGVFCFGDLPGRGGAAVMPICGATLELVRAVVPAGPVESALDLGCGAAPVGLLLARSARRVVATDVNPRAAAFARLNAAVNGVENLEVRVGDLYEPVRGERFDRVAAHPPFVARPAGATESTFVHGGSRGDELPLRVLEGAARHLTPAGRAVVLGDWPLVDEDALDARVRGAVGAEGADVLVLQSPAKNLDEYCALHAAVEHRELGDAFARAAIAHREHLDQLGIRGLALACVVVSPGTGWTSLVSVRHVHDAPLTGEAIDRLLAARRLAFGPTEALAQARLRVPAGARLVEQPMPAGAPLSVIVQLPAGRPEWPAVLEGPLAAEVARIAQAARVAEAGPDAVNAAREALLRGALDVAPA